MAIIKSKNFKLRPFRKGDENSLAKNINNKNVAKTMLRAPFPYTLKDAKKWIRHNLDLVGKKRKTEINFALEINGEVAGGIGFSRIEGHKAEIGYWLAEKHWGKGIMTKALKMITKYGFAKLGLRRIYVYAFSFNKASIRVLEKAGYKYEGLLRKHVKKGGRLIDNVLFAKIR